MRWWIFCKFFAGTFVLVFVSFGLAVWLCCGAFGSAAIQPPIEYLGRLTPAALILAILAASAVGMLTGRLWPGSRPKAEALVVEGGPDDALDALQESQRAIGALLDAVRDTAILVGLDGAILAINEVAARRVGKRADELVGTNLYDLFSSEVAESRRLRYQQVARSGKPVRFEDQRAGAILDNNIYPIFDADGKVQRFAVFARDITEQRKAQQSLRESQQQLELILRYSHDGISIVEWDPGTHERRLVMCNDRYVEMSGRSREQLMSCQDISEFIRNYHVEVRPLGKDAPEDWSSHGQASWIRPDGRENYFEWDATRVRVGQKYYVMNVDRDITERKRSEEHMQLLSLIVEHMTDAVILGDSHMQIKYVNKALCDMYGYTKEEVVGKSSRMLFAGTDDEFKDFSDKWTNASSKGEQFEIDSPDRRKDGSRFWVSNMLFNVNLEQSDERYWLAILCDVTERRRTERQMQLLTRIVEHMTDAVCLSDQDRQIQYVNDAFCKMYGYNREELLGKDNRMLFAGTDEQADRLGAEVLKGVADGGQFRSEHQDRRKDGSAFWVSAGIVRTDLGQPGKSYWLGIVRDITERRAAEEMLKKAKDQLEATVEKRTAELRAINKRLMAEIVEREAAQQLLQDRQTELSAIFDNTPVMITLVDRDMQICTASRAAGQFSGRTVDQMIGLRLGQALCCSEYKHNGNGCTGDCSFENCPLYHAVSESFRTSASRSVRATLRFGHGQEQKNVTLLIATTGVNISGRQLVLVCMEDITEITLAVQARADFVANASHQLRTPLTTMRAALEMLETQQPSHRLVQILARHLMRLEKLTNDLLDLHRLDAGRVQVHSEPVNVALLCQELLEPYSRQIKQKDLQFDVQLPDESIEVLMDGNLFSQVICNLVDNAMKFTDRGRVTVNVGVSDQHLTLSVADTGWGIVKDQHDRVFERFYKQDNNSDPSAQQVSGTGLGLAMVNGAVAALGGSIRLDSELGSGSLFTVSIPVQQIS